MVNKKTTLTHTIKNSYRQKLCLHKAYFECGYGLTHYLFKVIAVLGLTSQALTATIYATMGYTVGCYLLGWGWYNSQFREAEIEIQNQFNPFVKEMRNSYSV